MWGPSSQRARVVAFPPQGVLLDMFLLVLFVGLYAGTNAIVRVTSQVWPYPSVQADLSPQGALLLYGRFACPARPERFLSRVVFLHWLTPLARRRWGGRLLARALRGLPYVQRLAVACADIA